MSVYLPENVKRLAPDEKFTFACHAGIECFTCCCRDLELGLTPYDVLRLKNELNLPAAEFLDRYVLIEKEKHDIFPRLYLTMIDDGKASCPFVSTSGCTVYPSRPGACRAYPLGRAVSQACNGRKFEFHVLLSEPHCRGFNCSQNHTAETWTRNQDLAPYNDLNDEMLTLFQHTQVKQGFRLAQNQVDMFLLALYNLDAFRECVLHEKFSPRFPSTLAERQAIAADDTSLLRFGIRWLSSELFGE